MGLSAARKRITDLLLSRAGVSLHPHRFGESEYRLGKRELGHIHGDHLVDIPFSTKVSDEVVSAGQALPHHVLPDSGWVSFYLVESGDDERASFLLRRSCELALQQHQRRYD